MQDLRMIFLFTYCVGSIIHRTCNWCKKTDFFHARPKNNFCIHLLCRFHHNTAVIKEAGACQSAGVL